MLIIGPSGSGKSTLTLQLATAGWSYLSDDELLLSLVDGEVEARGFRSFFALHQRSGESFEALFRTRWCFGTPRTTTVIPRLCFFTRSMTRTKRRLQQADASRNDDAFDQGVPVGHLRHRDRRC